GTWRRCTRAARLARRGGRGGGASPRSRGASSSRGTGRRPRPSGARRDAGRRRRAGGDGRRGSSRDGRAAPSSFDPKSDPTSDLLPGSAGLLEGLALFHEAREELLPRGDEGGGAVALELRGERVHVDACLGEAAEDLFGVPAVVGEHG